MSRKTKDITESQWLELVDSEHNRELERPPNSKTIWQVAKIWKYSVHHARVIMKQKLEEGSAEQTMVGNKAYYTLK